MKILVPCKRVPDPDQKLRLNADGTDIDAAALTYILNPFDAIAVEEALRIRETAQPDAEIIAVSIAPAEGEADLRTALAMGADRALLIEHNGPLDPWNVARLLVAVIERESPGLVLMGKQAVDDDANQTGQFLAAQLGWPQATFASEIEFVDNGLRVHRETDLGIEVIRTTLPAVVTADLRLNEPRYASLPSILKAKKKTIDHTTAAELGITLEPRVRLLDMELINSQRNCVKVNSATELLEKLRETEVVN
ncbi:MAG: electron transfer flavoprotein subunit beta [Verrucomicrobiales bacterium]|nr:electron transfer flavoprotein subunit beta [Verrucomicrobiales bacterium]